MKNASTWLILGAAFALIGVLLGAFGAHALRNSLGPEMLAVWKTAVEYEFYHSFGLLAIGLLAMHRPPSRLLQAAGWSMAAGVLLFSGSLYALALSAVPWLGMVTPFGGVAFIVAWGLLVAALLRAD